MFRYRIYVLVTAVLLAPAAVFAQAGSTAPVPPAQAPIEVPVQVEVVTVTATKEPAEAQKLPVSVTALTQETLERSGSGSVAEAAILAPNTFFSELTARKISNATFRGIGSGPANPGVTTVIDGVPQLNNNSSSLGMRDIGQIEFVRGPESALFGRNTLGGVVNITSRRPRLTAWGGQVILPFGTEATRGIQGSFSGPIRTNKLALGVAFDYGQRDGYSTNTVTTNDLDYRESFSAKAQLLWTPSATWETRVIVTAERDRDGDYALNDLATIRADPFRASRDYEGRTDRDVWGTTFLARRIGPRVVFSSVTGVVNWKTEDLTDLDYTPFPLITRDNHETDLQFTQELRWASAGAAPVTLSDGVDLKWQAGLFLFTQRYTQDAVNTYAPLVISPFIDFPTNQHTPRSTLDDLGVGFFGQATFVFGRRLDLALGARVDHERKDGLLETLFDEQLPGATKLVASKSFSSVSPQVSAAFHLTDDRTVYASVGQGFTAGGFNPSAPAGSEAYDEEHAWHVEGGWKSVLARGRVTANASVFYIDWQDMQLNVPDPFVPGQFYLANVGNATSRGAELEITARPHRGVSLFTSIGATRARFASGSTAAGQDVGGHTLQNTPKYTAVVGAELSRALSSTTSWFGRIESVSYGAFKYDPSNTAGQDAYSLANIRAGIRAHRVLAELWVRNAFDTKYVPTAFPYTPLAPSGFLGEPGRPRTAGVSVGVTF